MLQREVDFYEIESQRSRIPLKDALNCRLGKRATNDGGHSKKRSSGDAFST